MSASERENSTFLLVFHPVGADVIFWECTQRPPHLSGGQCQRIAVVREASADFDRLVLDEPFSGIDFKAVPKLGVLLARAIDRGVKVVITSHTALPDALLSIPVFTKIAIERVSDKSATVMWPPS